jgi:porin
VPVPEYGGCWFRRPKLSGDWCGVRQRWAQKGVFLDLDWTQAAQGVIDGGREERWAHLSNLDLRATLDLTRMRAVPGALVTLRAQSRFGDTVNGDSGLLLPVHTYGYFPYTETLDEDVPIALTELNWLQMVSEEFGFLLGKITTMTVANEFASGEGRTQFMNFQFIFPSVFAQVAPYSTLAGGVVWMPSPDVTVSSLVLNTADSSTETGFDDFDDGQTWWTSATFTWGACSRPGGVTAGAAYAFNGDFARIGGLILDPTGGVSLSRKEDAWAAFASGWQYLFTLEPARAIDPNDGRQDLRGLGVFAILGAGDEDTNPVQWTVAGGLSGKGLIPGRCNDTMGLGYFYNHLGDPITGSRLGRFLGDSNQGVEAYYTVALAGSVGLTFDAQWTQSGVWRVEDAFILGVRLNVDF